MIASCSSPKLVRIEQRSPPRSPPREVGDRSEVHTAAGDRQGYVVRTCQRDESILGVDCLGTRTSHGQSEFDALHADIETLMKPIAMGVGYGIGCDERDRGFRVYVNHYSEVDAAVERAGELCTQRDLSVRFSIHLMIASRLL